MSISIHDAGVLVFVDTLHNMSAWLDMAASEKPEDKLLVRRLAPDMKPLPAQYQMASDSAKNAVARLAGIEAPSMPTSRRPSPSSRSAVTGRLRSGVTIAQPGAV